MARVQIFFEEPSMTKQSFKDECDINLIMKRFRLTGQITNSIEPSQMTYGDFSDVPDYRTALERVERAQDAFMSLPAEVRKRFDNDPGSFIDFALDSKNLDELSKLGLTNLPPKEEKKEVGT